jgi:hypothetical protein
MAGNSETPAVVYTVAAGASVDKYKTWLKSMLRDKKTVSQWSRDVLSAARVHAATRTDETLRLLGDAACAEAPIAHSSVDTWLEDFGFI